MCAIFKNGTDVYSVFETQRVLAVTKTFAIINNIM